MAEHENLKGLVVGEEEIKALGRCVLAGAHAGVNFDHEKTMTTLTMAVAAAIITACEERLLDKRVIYQAFCDSLANTMALEEAARTG